MNVAFSRRAALVAGVALPLLETWRRWAEWGQLSKLPSILDDFVAGGFLIAGAVLCRRDPTTGRPWLAAAWGVATGMMYYSFFGQLVALGQPDPSGVPSIVVVAFKGVLFAGCIWCLGAALRVPVPDQEA
ncbi:MAG TPA: hypothetical protein VE964_18830 [Myxococcales bacterium]|nr:hypothetical protein [Myxococcales bacterium]